MDSFVRHKRIELSQIERMTCSSLSKMKTWLYKHITLVIEKRKICKCTKLLFWCMRHKTKSKLEHKMTR